MLSRPELTGNDGAFGFRLELRNTDTIRLDLRTRWRREVEI